MVDICIVTYNRPFYLEKCIWSIAASTKMQHRVFVIDDNSTDRTPDLIRVLKERGLIHTYISNKVNRGTAYNFNRIIEASESPVFVMANDDMWFHRGWDDAVFEIYNNYEDAGLVSFYDYSRYNLDEGVEKVGYFVRRVVRSGLGATLVNRALFKDVGGFYLPNGRLMGYLATPFCKKAEASSCDRSKHYATIPHYATHMDMPHCKLNERDILEKNGYADHRRLYKRRK